MDDYTTILLEQRRLEIKRLTHRADAAEAEVERLRGAIELLNAQEVISASRARELHGMTPQEQRTLWREFVDGGISISAIDLRISHNGVAEVLIERAGKWHRVIHELTVEGGITGHIVEALGIRAALAQEEKP